MRVLTIIVVLILYMYTCAGQADACGPSCIGGGYNTNDDLNQPSGDDDERQEVEVQDSYAAFSLPWLSEPWAQDTGYCFGNYYGYGWTGTLIWPVDGELSSRLFRIGHQAIDIESEIDSPVWAAASGVVMYAGWNHNGYGNLVAINHGSRITIYAHLNDVSVSCGQSVYVGQTIGSVGMTGGTTFPHLHFGVVSGNRAYNPMLYLADR